MNYGSFDRKTFNLLLNGFPIKFDLLDCFHNVFERSTFCFVDQWNKAAPEVAVVGVFSGYDDVNKLILRVEVSKVGQFLENFWNRYLAHLFRTVGVTLKYEKRRECAKLEPSSSGNPDGNRSTGEDLSSSDRDGPASTDTVERSNS